jgi:hypothetical protein
VRESTLKGPLNCVFRVFAVAKYSVDSVIDPPPVTLVEVTESI